MLKEFKDFAMAGSLIDIAIGLVMGVAFGSVSSAFVDGIFMPLVGEIIQVGDLSNWKIVLAQASIGPDGKEIPANTIYYGKFISTFINFLIIAWVMFILVKIINKLKGDAPDSGPSQEQLLTEIRDLLKK